MHQGFHLSDCEAGSHREILWRLNDGTPVGIHVMSMTSGSMQEGNEQVKIHHPVSRVNQASQMNQRKFKPKQTRPSQPQKEDLKMHSRGWIYLESRARNSRHIPSHGFNHLESIEHQANRIPHPRQALGIHLCQATRFN